MIDEALEQIRVAHRLPALAAAAVRNGELVAIGVTGVRKFGAEPTVTQEDRWHIGSCTKSMTSSLAGVLVEDKKIRWETAVGEVFPELAGKMKPAWRAVTLEQLLTHHGGAPANAPAALWRAAYRRTGTPLAQRLAFVGGLLAAEPEAASGSKFIYSNQGYAIAGAMLERVMKTPWEDLMRHRLFQPLGLSSAGFGAPGEDERNAKSSGRPRAGGATITQPWGHVASAGKLQPVEPGPDADNPPAIGPAGTVHCSIGDLARYAGWHAQSGSRGRGLLAPESFQKLHRAQPGDNYAMGWRVLERSWAGGTALTHAGSNTMWYAVMWVAPGKELALVAATNIAGPSAEMACDEAATALLKIALR